MTDKQIIEKELIRQRKTNADIAHYLHVDNNYVWKRINRSRSYKVCDFIRFLDALGMECIVRPKTKFRTKYKVTIEEE